MQSLTSKWRGCCWCSVLHHASTTTCALCTQIWPDLSQNSIAKVWRCLQRLVGIEGDSLTEDMARLPLCFGGLGLRSAVRTSPAAHWVSWADSLPTFQKRHPGVARMIITRLSDHAGDLHYNVPNWEQIADGLRPGVPVEDPEPRVPRHGWQFHAAQAMDDCFFRHAVVPRLSDTQQAMVRSQSGPLAGVPFTCLPTHIAFDSHRRSGFPGVVASPPLAPSPIVRLRLPVWPSTPRPWPPPVSVCDVGSFGSERLCT